MIPYQPNNTSKNRAAAINSGDHPLAPGVNTARGIVSDQNYPLAPATMRGGFNSDPNYPLAPVMPQSPTAIRSKPSDPNYPLAPTTRPTPSDGAYPLAPTSLKPPAINNDFYRQIQSRWSGVLAKMRAR